MRIIKRTRIIVIMLILISFVALLTGRAEAGKRIGILTFSSQARYLETVRGIRDALKEAGFGEAEAKITLEDAGANKAKAAELVQHFSSGNMDLIFTVGTQATIAVTQKVKDVPIVFAQVYDPVAAGIARSWESSGNNTTGATSKLPMSTLIDSLMQFVPVKRLGVLYTPGEKNSEIQLKDLQGIQASYGIKVIPVPLARAEEVMQLLPLVIGSTDALYVTGSNLVNSQLSSIVDLVTKARLVTISHLEDVVDQGVLIGVAPSSYLIGRLAGAKAVKIFQGAQPSSIPIETLKEFDVIINLKTAKAGGFQVPPDFMKTVRSTIE